LKLELKMDKQRARQLYELADRLSKLDVKTLSEEQRQQRSSMIAKLQEEVRTIKEFAPDAGDGGEEETLHKYARMWYNGDLATQQQVEQVLARMGWEIGEIESEEGGAFVVQAGDENGDSYIGFAVADLTEDVNEASQRVDSLVTDALKLMRGSDVTDAVQALKTVLGDREFSSRRGHYNFFIRQMMDMYKQRGVTETKKPSPKLTPVNMKKTDPVSEEINNEAYERLQKVFAFKNYES
jgi:hypothetical protein